MGHVNGKIRAKIEAREGKSAPIAPKVLPPATAKVTAPPDQVVTFNRYAECPLLTVGDLQARLQCEKDTVYRLMRQDLKPFGAIKIRKSWYVPDEGFRDYKSSLMSASAK